MEYNQKNALLETKIHNLRCIIKALLYLQQQGIEIDPAQLQQLDLSTISENNFLEWVNKLRKKEWDGLEDFVKWFKYTARGVKQYQLAKEIGIDKTHLSQVLQGKANLTKPIQKLLINFRKNYYNDK